MDHAEIQRKLVGLTQAAIMRGYPSARAKAALTEDTVAVYIINLPIYKEAADIEAVFADASAALEAFPDRSAAQSAWAAEFSGSLIGAPEGTGEHRCMNDLRDPRKPRMRHCWVCGAELGVFAARDYDRFDDCGSRECQRETRDALAQERDEAHDQLDRDRGW